MTVNRLDKFVNSTLATHREGEIILSDKTSLGYTGFENKDGLLLFLSVFLIGRLLKVISVN